VVFGQRLIANNFRAVIVEAMIASVLEPEWRWCSADWAGWDLERADGVRLEVKQSAAKQTWHSATDKPSSCSFDIRAREGRYEGAAWFEGRGRNADLYIFAHHDICDESADHADPTQWTLYVVRSNDLPDTKSIGLQKLRMIARPETYADLKEAVEAAAERLLQDRQASVRTA
jgi:hypothetical protein